MTDRQSRFVLEYLNTYNAEEAARRAGYAPGQGTRLMDTPCVIKAIYKLGNKTAEKFEVTRESIMQELAAIGFANLSDFINVKTVATDKLCIHPVTGEAVTLPIGHQQDVQIVDTDQVSKDKQAAVSAIKQGAHGIEIKLHDKVRALELLGKALGVFDNGGADSTDKLTENLESLKTVLLKKVPNRELTEGKE